MADSAGKRINGLEDRLFEVLREAWWAVIHAVTKSWT